jgi:hypothetical protein
MRHAKGGYVDHVLNRAIGRATRFAKATDHEAFVRVLSEALDWVDIRLPIPSCRTIGTWWFGRSATAISSNSCVG